MGFKDLHNLVHRRLARRQHLHADIPLGDPLVVHLAGQDREAILEQEADERAEHGEQRDELEVYDRGGRDRSQPLAADLDRVESGRDVRDEKREQHPGHHAAQRERQEPLARRLATEDLGGVGDVRHDLHVGVLNPQLPQLADDGGRGRHIVKQAQQHEFGHCLLLVRIGARRQNGAAHTTGGLHGLPFVDFP